MKIALIVGASGTGKDSLLRAARSYFTEKSNVVFLQRYITRPPDINEDNYYLDTPAFTLLQDNSFFISHWQAHGNSYGIAAHHIEQIPDNGLAVISVSRTVPPDFEQQYDQVFTIQIDAGLDLMRQRLLKRNREDRKAIEQRLNRARLSVPGRQVIHFDNSQALNQTAPTFIHLLESLLKR